MTNHQKAIIAIILASFIGGGIAVVSKLALQEIPPFSMNFFRFLVALLCIIPLGITFKSLRIHRWKVYLVALLGTANTVIFSFGVEKTSATVSQILYASVPLLIVLISYVLFNERFRKNQLIGIILGFIGVAVIILTPIITGDQTSQSDFMGNLIILFAVLCFSFYTILSKHLHESLSSLQLTRVYLFTSFLALLFLAPTDLFVAPQWWDNVTWIGIISIFYLGTFGLIVWYLLYQYAIKHGTPSIASLTFYLQPIATFIWASVLLHEQLELSLVIGTFITFIGLWITTSDAKSKKALA